LYAFGGCTGNEEVSEIERIRNLDHLKPQAGWRVLSLNRPLCGYGYGLINIDPNNTSLSVLICGGSDKDETTMNGCIIF
jgi:hypothetical protein